MNGMHGGAAGSDSKTLAIGGLTEEEKKALLRIAIPGPITVGIAS